MITERRNVVVFLFFRVISNPSVSLWKLFSCLLICVTILPLQISKVPVSLTLLHNIHSPYNVVVLC